MAEEISDELFEVLLARAVQVNQLSMIDFGTYSRLSTDGQGNAFFRAKSQPGEAVPFQIQTHPPIDGTLSWRTKEVAPSARPLGSLKATREFEATLSPMLCEGSPDEDDENIGDDIEQELDEPSDPSGEFHVELTNSPEEAMDLRITPPNSDETFIAVIQGDGRLEIPDRQTEEALLHQESQIEIRTVISKSRR